MSSILIFLASLVALWFGAELITKAAIKIAKCLALSEGFVGLTILAIGTDFPEIVVAVTGAIQKLQGKNTSEIIIGNVIGSTMSQITLVLGIAGLMKVMRFKKESIFFDAFVLVATTTILYVTASDGMISVKDGIIFVLLYIVYLLFLNRRNLKEQVENKKTKKKKTKIKLVYFIQLFIGLFLIAKSSELVLEQGTHLATQFGISEMMVGVLLIGLGTSLPELVVSTNAAMKGATSLAISNLIGSNIVDILLALGGSAIIGSWDVSRSVVQFDLPYLTLSTIIVVLFILTKGKLERKESLLILSLYFVYLTLKVMGF